MNKFSKWYNQYQAEITWFVIGILFNGFLQALATGNGVAALIDLILIYINYYFWKQNVR